MLTILLFIIAFIVIVWLALLTIFFWSLSAHYNDLVKTTNKKNLQGILESILQETQQTKKDVAELQQLCDRIVKDSQFYIQKIGLLRFNPFKDTGGDQSFILSLVDGKDNGVIISGLYSRTGTRWYAKKIKNGVGVEHTLSDEEKAALKEAKQTA